jgi:hypothetical protein
MSLSGDDHQKLVELCSLTYKEQLVWFLNAFWTTIGERDAEHFWDYQRKCSELDLQHRQAGSALDEMNAHVFLEHFKETMTVRAMRERLRESGAIGATERPKNVPITHILLFKYGVNWHELVNATQGDNKEEIAEAQRRLEAVQTAFREAEARAQEAAAAVREATAREAAAYKSEEDARVRESEAEAAKAELEVALAEVKAQEDAYNAKTQDLTQKSESGSIVARNKAKNELAQHLGEDPLPLRRAKITAEAAVKKADRTRAAAAAAREAAARDAKAATEARTESERAKAAAEEAVDEAQRQVGEAEQYLNEVKRKPGQAMGALWWIERELHEAKAYLPESKGGYRKPK